MDPVVRLRGAVALTGRFPALSGADLTVAPGGVVSLLGPNGAGKTTLLRVLAGLVPVRSGEATVLGVDLREDPGAIRRRVGLLGHAPALYDELSARENLRFALRAAGCPGDRVEPALAAVGITGRLATAPAGRLSAGQRRRVALGILVGRAPELWLLDEPHAGLDAGARRLLGELVAEAAAGGAAVLLSSHEPDLAVPMADRVMVMSGGRIAEERPGGRRPPLAALVAGDADVA
jgi:heme ABC exporter ATP-binding subunit CcmA